MLAVLFLWYAHVMPCHVSIGVSVCFGYFGFGGRENCVYACFEVTDGFEQWGLRVGYVFLCLYCVS